MFRRRFAVLGIAAALAACGGGGGGTSAPGGGTPNTVASTGNLAPASFSITIPSASASAKRRSPKDVPAGTQSIQFTLLKTDAPGITTPAKSPVYPLLASSPGCSSGSAGITCVIQIQAPVGDNIYLAEVFATSNGTGTHIGSGAVELSVQANATNSTTLTLVGPIAAAYVETNVVPLNDFYAEPSVLPLSPLASVTYNGSAIPTSGRIFVVALDAQGDQIITPDTFDKPVTLTLNPVQVGDIVLTANARRTLGSFDPTMYATISTTYAYPGTGATTASTSTGQPTITIESPADNTVITPISTTTGAILSVTATLNGVVQPLVLDYTILNGTCPNGEIGTPPFGCGVAPTPTPSPTPTPTATPSATPSPTPSPTPLMWPTTEITSDSANYTPINGNGYQNNPLPYVEFPNLPVTSGGVSNAITIQLSGGATLGTTGTVTIDASSCAGQLLVSPTGAMAADGAPINVTLTNAATAPIGCQVSATDGITTAPLNVYVDNYSVTVSGKKRKQ